MKAYCKRCKASQEHRLDTNPVYEIVCNACGSIAIAFHEPVVIVESVKVARADSEGKEKIEGGSKYKREIGSQGDRIIVDVYDVLKAFGVACPARQHAIKKLLAAGQRGHKTELEDLQEAASSIARSIQLAE